MSIAIKNDLEHITIDNAKPKELNNSKSVKSMPQRNIDVKTSMAIELREIGLSKAAIGRVLHVPVKDVEVMLKKYDQLET